MSLGADVATVVPVIDGDTFDAVVEGREESVRLLKVDTPETKHPEKTGRYGRTLAGAYPGYTGPRCYAPGGQSWKPC